MGGGGVGSWSCLLMFVLVNAVLHGGVGCWVVVLWVGVVCGCWLMVMVIMVLVVVMVMEMASMQGIVER